MIPARMEKIINMIEDEGISDLGIVDELLDYIEELNEQLLEKATWPLITSTTAPEIWYPQQYTLLMSRINKACAELESMIDGAEECRGKDSQVSYIIQILQGEV